MCRAGPNKFLCDILCQRRLLLFVVSRRDQCSVPFSFLSTPDAWRNSFKILPQLPHFADDSELYSCLPTERESAQRAIGNVESCCHEIKRWMTKNKLKLNERKTEALLRGPPSWRESVPYDSLLVGEASIPFSNVVKTL